MNMAARDSSRSQPRISCACGNSTAHEGFYACDAEGRRLESSDLLCCERCGKITVRATGSVVGHRSFPLPASLDSGAA